ncbi:four helix bundle protein [Pontiellaceae bacterium B1224]|nr:four helix bundle protein [Pontiellaceae bacterium B1224]
MSKEKTFDLEDRLVGFAARCIKVSDSLPLTKAGQHLAGQLCRSGSSPALNYGEAQGAESRKDFVHKMSVSLKELRETRICLKIVMKAEMLNAEKLQPLADEANELISIFVTSIKTAKQNIKKDGVR